MHYFSWRSFIRNVVKIFIVFAILLQSQFFVSVVPVLAANPTPIQIFFLSMPEDQVFASFKKITTSPAAPMHSVTGISVTTSGTWIYYDQWENGYELDLANPTNTWTSGNLGGTQIWGNGDVSDGCPPNKDGLTILTCTIANDSLTMGDTIVLENNVPLPRTSAIFYDGRDKLGSNKVLAVTRSLWAATPGTVLADAVEVYDTTRWGTYYEMPIGENTTNSPGTGTNTLFSYSSAMIIASQNGTSVTIDPDGPGATAALPLILLNQGEAYQVNGGMKMGGTVISNNPIQVNLLTGKVGSTYASRWFSLPPQSLWTNSLWTSVGTTVTAYPSTVFIFNPSDAAALTVNYETRLGTGSFSVPINGTYRFEMPLLSGAHFYTSGATFQGVGGMDTSLTGADQTYDWGYTLVPDTWLTTAFVAGWAPGTAANTANGSPVWVTAIKPTTVYVDYGAPSLNDSGLADPNGKYYDVALALGKYESLQIKGEGNTQTGMKVWTVDGTSITGAWGEDPKTASAGTPFLDVGYTIPPLPMVVLTKSAALAVGGDGNGNGKVDAGDTIQYSLKVENKGAITAFSTVVKDSVPANTTYVLNSTKLDGVAVPDIASPFFPLTGSGVTIATLEVGASKIFTYQMLTDPPGSYTEIVNTAKADLNGDTFTVTLHTPLVVVPVTSCALTLRDITYASTVTSYQQNGTVYVQVTDGDKNTIAGTAETITVQVVDATTTDRQALVLTETDVNTGIFHGSLPSSTTLGQLPDDGTLYALSGDSLSATYTDLIFPETCSATATITTPSLTKQLYFNESIQSMNRVVPTGTTIVSPFILGTTSGGGGTNNLTITANRDNYMRSQTNRQTRNYGTTTTVQVDSGSGTIRRTLVGFNLSTIPAGATINSASLNMVKTNGSGTFNTGAYRVTSDWDEGTFDSATGISNWTQRKIAGPVTWTTAGGDFAATPISTTSVTATNQLYSWDVKSLVQSWLSGTANYGILLKRTDESLSTNSHTFGSLNNTTASNRPTLTVNYTVTSTSGPATTFVQAPNMAANLSLPSGGAVKVITYIRVISGTLPTPLPVTVALEKGGSAFTPASGNPTVTLVSGSDYKLEWNITLGSNTTISAGQAVTTRITTAASGVTFKILYGSSTGTPPLYQSRIELPTTTVIKIDSLDFYDAPYSTASPLHGTLLPNPTNGQTVYIRAVVSDPFGEYDITSASLEITDPAPALTTIPLTDADMVANSGALKTYEKAWLVPAASGDYTLKLTAKEGTENSITDTRSKTVAIVFQDTGTPSKLEFTTGSNGSVTSSYDSVVTGSNPLLNQICIRLTEFDKNKDTGAAETLTVSLNSTKVDPETITLTETGVNTGIFVKCVTRKITSGPLDGLIYALAGDLLTVNYVDLLDPSDATTASAIMTTTAATPLLVVSKKLVEPSNGIAVIGERVRFDITVGNPNLTDDLYTIPVTDTFPSTCLSYVSASVSPNSTTGTTLTWNDVGPLVPLSSKTINVYFDVIGICAPGSNIVNATALYDNGGNDASATAPTLNSINAPITTTRPRIKVTKTLTSTPPAVIGNDVTFSITLNNTGTSTISTLPLTDNYSAYCLQYKSDTRGGNGSGGTISWSNLGPLTAGASTTVIITFTVLGPCNPAQNTAIVDSAIDSNGDPVSVDPASVPSATLTVTVPRLGLTKSNGVTRLSAGDNTTYTLTMSNTGGANTIGTIVIVDVLPTGLSVTDGVVTLAGTNASDWTCNAASNIITCTSSVVIQATSGTSIFSFVAAVASGASGTLINKAQAGGGGDLQLTNTPTSTTAATCTAIDTPTKGCAIDSDTVTVAGVPVVTIAVAPSSVLEDGATDLVYTVTMDISLGVDTIINLSTTGTATSGSDYTGTLATVTITAGNKTGTITINPTTDTTIEPDETVIITIVAGTGYTVGEPSSATGTITNDDSSVATISVSPSSVLEDGATNLVYTVTLDKAPLVNTTINLTTTGTATSGSDYTGTVASVTILAGATTVTVTINPTTDIVAEPDETVILTITSGTGYTVGVTSSATGTITNDDVDLSLTKTVNNASPKIGDVVIYTVTITNHSGTTAATNIVVHDALPAGLTLNSSTPSLGSYSASDWTIPTLAANTSATLQLNVTVTQVGVISNTAEITAAGQTDPDSTPNNDIPAEDDQASVSIGGVFDPPSGIKTFNDGGLPEMEFRMVWINSGNTSAINVQVTDTIPPGTTYVSGSVACVPRGSSTNAGAATAPLSLTATPNSFCGFDSGNNLIQWQGNIGPDNGNLTEAAAANEVVITFRVTVNDNVNQVFNTASARTDTDGDGVFTDEVGIGASQSLSNQATWNRDDTLPNSLPKTGFAPNVITALPEQPASKMYSSTTVSIEIPSINVNIPIVGVPIIDKEWDISWLWNQAGWLNGTAFPGWSGNSVLTGHTTLSNGKSGPFVGLGRLKWGDKIIVHAYGSVYTYEVRENRTVSPNNTSVLRHEEEPWVTLITCKTFNEKTETYSKRIAVRAVLIKVELEK